jgi:hypothetical protein
MGGSAMISTAPAMMAWCEETLKNRDAAWLFEYPRLRVIDKKLQEFGHEIADIHQYYLPKPDAARDERELCVRWYEAEDIGQFQNDDRFQEAFVFDENNPDVLAIAALDGETIMGMAGSLELFAPAPGGPQLSKTLRLGAFLDFGNVWETNGSNLIEPTGFDIGALRYSAGVSATWLSPIGALSISLAAPLNEEEGDETQVFQFGFGQTF